MFKRPSEKIYFLKKKGTDIKVGEMDVPDTEVAKTPGLFAPNVGLAVSDIKSRPIQRAVRPAAPMKSLEQRLYEEELKRKAQTQIASAQPAFPSMEEQAVAPQGPAIGPATELEALVEAAKQLNPSDRAVAFEQLKNLQESQGFQPPIPMALQKGEELRRQLVQEGKTLQQINAELQTKGYPAMKKKTYDKLVSELGEPEEITGKGLIGGKKGKKKMMSEDIEGGKFGMDDLFKFGKKAYEEGEKLYKIGKKVYDVAKPIVESEAGKKGISMVSKKLFGGELEDDMPKVPARPFWMNMKNPLSSGEASSGTVSAKIEALKAEMPVEKSKTSQHKMLVF